MDLKDWIGRTERATDCIDGLRARGLRATFDEGGDEEGLNLEQGAPLPPLWHWLYFWDVTSAARLGAEGHTALGDFLPPVDLPRRMWAGSRLAFLKPLRIGETARRESRILQVAEKEGRSGRLVFVTVRHEISGPDGPAIEEEHDIVYRDAPPTNAAAPKGDPAPDVAPGAALWCREITAGPVLLFRYSALTFNAHRIHYDQDYTRQEEGYPGLLVHGPLLATFMVNLVRTSWPEADITRFAFRARSPIFAGRPFMVAGRPEGARAEVWIADDRGQLAMAGQVTLAQV